LKQEGFSDAQQKQENQIKALRSFIAQKVDVIAFAPVVESGWDTVLKEIKAAKIPVILTDRSVDSKDTSLYVTFMGSDFTEEGRKAGRWLLEKVKNTSGDVNVVELQGTVGSGPAIDRKKGFEEIIKAEPRIKIIRSQTGDFTRAKGKEVMEAFMDNVAVLKDAKNIENAKLFQNFMMEPENAALASEFAGYDNGITGSHKFLPEEFANAPEINPPASATTEFVPPCSPAVVETYKGSASGCADASTCADGQRCDAGCHALRIVVNPRRKLRKGAVYGVKAAIDQRGTPVQRAASSRDR
jgi:hypothetical protein